MKPNVIGIVAGVIAFISIALPWWTETASMTFAGTTLSGSQSIYLYQVTLTGGGGLSMSALVDIWYGGTALYLIVFGGFLGIVGSLVRSTRLILVAGGLLALLSAIIFAAGLQSALSPVMSLFHNGTIGYVNYTAYLSFGFWLALASAIIMLVASIRKPRVSPPQSPTPPAEKVVPEKEVGTSCLRNKKAA